MISVDRDGLLSWSDRQVRCALGRGGVRHAKQEGDGATPAGRFPLRRVFYRPDRLEAPRTRLPVLPLFPDDAWCDDPDYPLYNTKVVLPYPARSERMWREDGLYDLVVVLGYNDAPVVPGAGSAIFLHVAAPDYAPTEGCVAVALEDLRDLLRDARAGSVIEID